MGALVPVELDDDVRLELLVQARSRGIGLAALLGELAAREAIEARRRRIREGSAAVARHAAASPEARAFFEEWGTPRTDAG